LREYRSLQAIGARIPRTVLALGVFDGFHLGHQKVIRNALSHAKRCQGSAVIFTFENHPLSVVDCRAAPPMLMTSEERSRILAASGAGAVVMTRFTKRLQFMPPEEFVEGLLKKMDLRAVVVGEDFRFGDDRVGNSSLLRDLGRKKGFRVVVVPPLKYRGQAISSSRIRQSIVYGWVAPLPKLLGKYYSVTDQVVAGDGVGRTIGVPTFNLPCSGRLLPKIGVYLVRARLRTKEHWGLANVGRAPTRKKRGKISLEVNLLDFRGKAKSLEVSFLERLREEKRFADMGKLREQIALDEAEARKLIAGGLQRGK